MNVNLERDFMAQRPREWQPQMGHDGPMDRIRRAIDLQEAEAPRVPPIPRGLFSIVVAASLMIFAFAKAVSAAI